MNRTYIIAEIGINFAYGKDMSEFINNAKKLIDVATFAGCDAVKFQKRNPLICVPKAEKNKAKIVPWRQMETTTYLQYKLDIEFNKIEYDIINNYCGKKKIEWSASVWDINSAKFMSKYNVPWIKIPSALLTDLDLISHCCKNFNKIILSTGMSTNEEINAAMDVIKTWKLANVVVMHCVSAYPAAPETLNLKFMETLKNTYPWATVGYSGHEIGLTTTMASVYLGAEYVERHLTLDHGLWGTDQSSSVEPQGFIKLVKGIRDLERAHGDGFKKITKEELEKRKMLRKSENS